MRRALELAERGWGRVRPNPMVGCVVVRDGEVVGEGWHEGPGTPHAEAMALEKAGPLARGATVHCTLEPCDHTGRTGPCTRALIDAAVARVVVATGDPNPIVGGRGFAALRAAQSEYAPFWCRTCRRSYCRDHWTLHAEFDPPGQFDYYIGSCPAGHRTMINHI